MEVDDSVLEHVAKVARLELTKEEKREFLPQLKQIIIAFSQIQEVDTKGVKPSYHAVKLDGKARDDMPKESLGINEALKNSKNNKDTYIKGPKIL